MIIRFKKFGIDLKQLFHVLLFGYLAVAPLAAVLSLAVLLGIGSSVAAWVIFVSSLATMFWWHTVKG